MKRRRNGAEGSQEIRLKVRKQRTERRRQMSQLLEEILSRENMILAYKRVKANKGASGVDGVTVEEIDEYLKENWAEIREQIRKRKYKPQPVRRVEIPKPNGGKRNLGIPTVIDRIIEQAIAQKTIADSGTAFQRKQLWIQTEAQGAAGNREIA